MISLDEALVSWFRECVVSIDASWPSLNSSGLVWKHAFACSRELKENSVLFHLKRCLVRSRWSSPAIAMRFDVARVYVPPGDREINQYHHGAGKDRRLKRLVNVTCPPLGERNEQEPERLPDRFP